MNKKRIITIIIILAIVGAIAALLVRNKKIKNEAGKPKETTGISIPVNVEISGLSSVDNSLIKTGTLIPNREADINALVSGKLISLNFSLGSYVSEGAAVGRIDNRTSNLAISAAELTRDQAKRDYDRYKALYEGDAAPQTNYQNAQLQYKSAQNQIEQLQKANSDYNIKAPISGQIVSKLKEPGEYLQPGAVLGHIVDMSKLKVNVLVGEADVYSIKVGQAVKVKTDIYPGVVFEGKISFISSLGDGGHNYPVEITLNNKKDASLKSGTFAYVDFSRQSAAQVMTVERSSLVASIANPYVYVVNAQNIIERRDLTLGKDLGNRMEVLSGLTSGEKVVTSGIVNVKVGTLVKPIIDAAPATPTQPAEPASGVGVGTATSK